MARGRRMSVQLRARRGQGDRVATIESSDLRSGESGPHDWQPFSDSARTPCEALLSKTATAVKVAEQGGRPSRLEPSRDDQALREAVKPGRPSRNPGGVAA